jgi:hypothetical protein
MTINFRLTLACGLLAGASSIALVGQAHASTIIFTTAQMEKGALEDGRPVSQTQGVTQVRLGRSAVASFVDAADFTILGDGSIELRRGSVTVASPDGDRIVVHMPGGVAGSIEGQGSAARFAAGVDGATGHIMEGVGSIAVGGRERRFEAGQFWRADAGGIDRIVADGAQSAPEVDAARIADMREGGPAAAAQNGVPVALGEALAAAGASGDVIGAARRIEASAGNPSLETFPAGDYALLVSYAARLSAPHGGQAFPGAGADIVRTYLQYLAGGGSREQFLSVYAGLLVQYLDLVRAGAAPSSFQGAQLDQINNFIAFQARTNGFGSLSDQNRTLVQAYLAFLGEGGNPDLFARRYTDLVSAYFAYLRGGGAPAQFQQATQGTINTYLAFLRDSGLSGQLSEVNRALLHAYLGSLSGGGAGLAFAEQYRASLGAFHVYLRSGFLPSGYDAADPALLRQYLETLSATGLLDTILGDQASFFSAYLVHLRGGGAPDAFAGLPANIFAGHAAALGAFNAYLAGGGLPSQYQAVGVPELRAYLQALQQAGALDRFLGSDAAFFRAYLAFLDQGGAADAFAGLPVNIYTGYAGDLSLYFAYLKNGGVPSGYTALTQAQIQAYLQALASSGTLARLLGENAEFYTAFLAYLSAGGNPDLYAGLPTPPNFDAFASVVQAYIVYLKAGGLPSGYTAANLATLRQYIEALSQAGLLASRFGPDAGLVEAYLAFIKGGGDPNGFAGLPVYTGYASALQAYFDFLANGGLPSAYGALTQDQIRAYLQALSDAGILGQLLAAQSQFLSAYLAFLQGGGTPDRFTLLPAFDTYAAALAAYDAFIRGGGKPSQYTVLSQAQLVAYVRALQAAGLLSVRFTAQQATFLAGYADHVGGGGNPDQYAGLPTGGPVPPAPLQGYTGGFTPAVANVNFIFGGRVGSNTFGGGETGFETTNFAVGSNGAMTSYTRNPGGNPTRTNGSAEVVDVFGNADAVIGRWTDGTTTGANPFVLTANQGLHYLLTRKTTPDFTLPSTGRIDYRVIAATKPTIVDGSLSPGRFDAQMALLFGSTVKVAMEGAIVMPKTGGDYRYSFSTAGGMAGAAQTETTVQRNGDHFTFTVPGSTNDNGCAAADCQISFFSAFAGSSPATIGTTYHAHHTDQRKGLVGAALFGAMGAGGGGSEPAVQTPTGDITGQKAWIMNTEGSRIGAATQVTYNNQGGVTGVEFVENGAQSSIGTAQPVDTGHVGSIVGWTRWAGGSPEGQGSKVYAANQGMHVLAGTPATALPASGKADYALVGATKPTENIFGGEGTFSGSASVAFGSSPRVGLDLNVAVNDKGWRIQTSGGVANPAASNLLVGGDMTFRNLAVPVTGTAGTACTGYCNAAVFGGLFGAGASHLGLVYSISQGSGASQVAVQGSAVFGR